MHTLIGTMLSAASDWYVHHAPTAFAVGLTNACRATAQFAISTQQSKRSGRHCQRGCACQSDVIEALSTVPLHAALRKLLGAVIAVAHLVVPVGLQRERLCQLHARFGGGDDAELVDALLVAVVAHLQAAAGTPTAYPAIHLGCTSDSHMVQTAQPEDATGTACSNDMSMATCLEGIVQQLRGRCLVHGRQLVLLIPKQRPRQVVAKPCMPPAGMSSSGMPLRIMLLFLRGPFARSL